MARLFNAAATDYLEYAGAISDSVTFTAAGWVYLGGSAVPYFDHFIQSNLISDNRGMTTGEGLTSLYCYSSSVADFGNSVGTGLTRNAWHHIGGVWNGNSSRTAYVDGVAATADTTTVTPLAHTATNIAFGAGGNENHRHAEWGAWNEALTADEMWSLAKGYNPEHVRKPIAYWPIMGRQSPEPDVMGGFNLTVLGTAAHSGDHPPIIYPRRPSIIRPLSIRKPPAGLIVPVAVQRAASW